MDRPLQVVEEFVGTEGLSQVERFKGHDQAGPGEAGRYRSKRRVAVPDELVCDVDLVAGMVDLLAHIGKSDALTCPICQGRPGGLHFDEHDDVPGDKNVVACLVRPAVPDFRVQLGATQQGELRPNVAFRTWCPAPS